MKTINFKDNIITYPNEFKDISFGDYLDITDYISSTKEQNLKIIIFDFLNKLVKIEGDIIVDDLPVSIGRDIVQDISKIINEINDYQIDLNPSVNKQVLKTNSKIINVENRLFMFETDLSLMKMSKYIELELLLADTTKKPIELLKGLLGNLFNEVIKKNDEIIYLDTEETIVINCLMNAKAFEMIKYINFFLSIAVGSKTDSKIPSKVTRNTKQKLK
jgi:hypothetical protein